MLTGPEKGISVPPGDSMKRARCCKVGQETDHVIQTVDQQAHNLDLLIQHLNKMIQ